MSGVYGKRITFKRTRPNPLFQSWLEELHEEACSKKSKLEPMLKEALTSLSKYPLPLLTGAECAILSGFDKRLCQFIDNRLEVYEHNTQSHSKITRKGNSSNTGPSNSESSRDNHIHAPETLSVPGSNGVSRKFPKKKQYKPAHRSGGYAILLGLLECAKSNKIPINKDNLIVIAQKYSEESFTRPKPETFYTAWSNMGKLVTKGLVKKDRGKNASYSLSEQGLLLANELFEEHKNIPSVNNQIFNEVDAVNPCSVSLESMKPMCLEKENDQLFDVSCIVNNQINEGAVREMNAGCFDVILLIDKNETSGLSKKNDPTIAQFQKYPDLKHEYRSLKVGDFTWIARHKHDNTEFVLPYIVERKRMDDLGASIKDGRFHEQKFRLRRCGLESVIYMVENYGSNKHVGLPVQSLMQALANTRVQDGFQVHMTDSLTHSARFLAMLTKRLTVKYKDKTLRGRNQEPDGDMLMTFEYFNKSSVKNRPLSVTDTFIKLLLQLKGVSVEKALAITKVYKTPSSLFKEYERCEKREGELLLANLKLNDDSRNVGPSVSKCIYQLFTFVT